MRRQLGERLGGAHCVREVGTKAGLVVSDAGRRFLVLDVEARPGRQSRKRGERESRYTEDRGG